MKIAFIGLGNMGGPMAANLVKAGYEVNSYDIIPERNISAEDKGCTRKDSIKSSVTDADFVITMLPEGIHVKESYLGSEGIVNNVSSNTLLIDCSTIDAETTKNLGKITLEKRIKMIDAPVSGGTFGAENATLTFMVGGTTDSLKSAQPLLNAMGKKIIHVGNLGSGQIVKACNNMLLAISQIALGEVFTLAEKLGVDQKKLFQVSSEGTGMSWAMLNHLPIPGIVQNSAANNDFKPGFAASMMLKDLQLARSAADSVNFDTQLGSLAESIYEKFIKSGRGNLDYSAIIKLVEESSKQN